MRCRVRSRTGSGVGIALIAAVVGPSLEAQPRDIPYVVFLGTEFSASVDRSGATELHVFDGEVEYEAGESPEILSAGNAPGGMWSALKTLPMMIG